MNPGPESQKDNKGQPEGTPWGRFRSAALMFFVLTATLWAVLFFGLLAGVLYLFMCHDNVC